IQKQGVQSGAIIDIRNHMVAITDPKEPMLQVLAMTLIGCSVAYALILLPEHSDTGRRSIAMICGVIGGLIASLIWSAALVAPSEPGIFLSGIRGWVKMGADSEAVHLLIGILVVTLVHDVARRHWSVSGRSAGQRTSE